MGDGKDQGQDRDDGKDEGEREDQNARENEGEDQDEIEDRFKRGDGVGVGTRFVCHGVGASGEGEEKH
jgi:hypothetical protein